MQAGAVRRRGQVGHGGHLPARARSATGAVRPVPLQVGQSTRTVTREPSRWRVPVVIRECRL
ncbi:hypothetical protein STRIP9103_09114 [Streptomyces ipomoeae 91-03]|uniref:Uncharacterized protein n=1 Tax=Streptomyces ipomoeae 91-03 TaxID=698759 RepID=L1KJY4_9ACTN|nr:hypothetical protein STRIP9103_09114 [Streptomyces ipomoeae 91-03]